VYNVAEFWIEPELLSLVKYRQVLTLDVDGFGKV